MARGSGEGRERLLDAAREHFSHAGFGGVTVAMVLDHAAVQPPTLYYHFQDKEGLYVAWAGDVLNAIQASLEEVAVELPVKQTLEAYSEILLTDLPLDVRQLLRDAELLTRPASREAVMTSYLQCIYGPLCAVMVRGTQSGEIRKEPIGALVEMFLAGVFALHKVQWNSPDPNKTASDWWAERFLAGFGR